MAKDGSSEYEIQLEWEGGLRATLEAALSVLRRSPDAEARRVIVDIERQLTELDRRANG